MRTKILALVVASLLTAFAAYSLAQKTDGKTETFAGLETVSFNAAAGKVTIYLPGDMAAGDTISGTVFAEPAGKDDEEKRNNAGTLSGYVVELQGQKSGVANGVLRKIILTPLETGPEIILLDEKGAAAGKVRLVVTPALPASSVAATFRLRPVGQAGRPMEVYGPFDGDSSNTSVKLGGSDLKVLAESPRKVVVQSPRDVVGSSQIEVKEASTSATGRFRNLKIDLTAPKTSLLRGESTELHVEVNGLEGLSTPINVQIQNQSPSTVNLAGGNTQTIPITPGSVQTGGKFTYSTGVTGVQSGGYSITSSVPGIYFGPNPATPPSTRPSPSPAPATSGDTVVTRPPPKELSGGGDNIRIELVELALASPPAGNPQPAQPRAPIPEQPEPEAPEIQPPPLRPPSLPSPTPGPAPPPRYTPEQAPTPPSTTPTIPPGGQRVIPKKPKPKKRGN